MTYNVGLLYDKYNPAVDGALFRDLLTLQDLCRKSKESLQIVCDKNDADRLLKSLGINRVSLNQLADLWLIYAVDDVENPPEHCSREVLRDLRVPKAHVELQTDNGNLFEFPEVGMDNFYREFDKPAPPNESGQVPINPLVTLLFGP